MLMCLKLICFLTISLYAFQTVSSADILSTLNAEGATELVHLLHTYGLDAALTNGNHTIFAPTNVALLEISTKVSQGTVKAADVTNLLKYHVISGSYTARQFRNDHDYASLSGSNVRVNVYLHRTVLMANGVEVKHKDIVTDNGVIHIVEQTIQPPANDLVSTLDSMTDAHDFIRLIKEAGLDKNLMNLGAHVTVFTPTNFAFATNGLQLINAPNSTYLTSVLKYHMVTHTYYSKGMPASFHPRPWFHPSNERLNVTKSADGAVNVNGAKVTQADIRASNGVIHFIDKVLFPHAFDAGIVG